VRGVIALGTLIGGYFLLTDSFLTRWIVMSQVGARVGGEASAASVSISRDGRLEVRGAEIRAPGVSGEGGVVFRADRVLVQVELGTILAGSVKIDSVTLEQPLARLSQSLEDGSVNIAALSPPKGGGGPVEIPHMIVKGGVIELGEHSQKSGTPAFTSLRRIPVGGEVERSRDQSGNMEIAFHELDLNGNPIAGPGGLQVEGTVSKDAVTLDLGVLSLSNWPPASMPKPLRATYESLGLEGQVYGAQLIFEFNGNVEARAYLSGVAMTLPMEAAADPTSDSPPRRLRMQDVRGTLAIRNAGLQANLDGLLEELPYHVELDYQGSAADSPFTGMMRSTNFALGQKPEILRFAPEKVRERLAQFSDPTGVLDAEIHLSRGAPVGGKAADVAVTGTLDFRKTTAAFERFPYRFYNMSGSVTFSEKEVVIDHIKGDAPGGVTMTGRVVVAPPNDDAAVDVDVVVKNLLIDDTLRQALKQRVALLDAVFNLSRYQELIDKGLVVPPERAGEASPTLPVFALTGRANVHTHVYSPPGKESPWHDRVEIEILDAGMLPEKVPYPVRAQGVTVVKDDASLIVSGGTYTGILGGDIKVHAVADIDALLDPARPAVPEIEAAATNLPANALLINAIPRTGALTRIGLADRLSALNLSGHVNLAAKVGTKNEDLDYRVQVDALQCTAAPRDAAGASRVAFRDVDGSVDASPDKVVVDITGRVTPPESSPATGRTHVQASLLDEKLVADVDATSLDLALPVEDLIRPVAPEGAEVLASLRKDRNPAGSADGKVHVTRDGEQSPVVQVIVSRTEDASVDAAEGRVGTTLEAGTVAVAWPEGSDHPGLITLSGAAGSFTYNHQVDGKFEASGAIRTDGLPGSEGGALSARLIDARLECGLLRQGMVAASSDGVAKFIQSANPRGRFDLELALASKPDRSGWNARGSFSPQNLTINLDGVDVAIPTLTGRVEFDDASGRIDHLVAKTPAWELHADGSFVRDPGGPTHLEVAGSLDAASLTPDLAAILPASVRQAAADLSIGVSKELHVPQLQMQLSFGPAGDLTDLNIDGNATVQGLALDPGVQIENAEGAIDFSVQRSGRAPVTFEFFGVLPTARVGEVLMTDAHVRVAGTPTGEVILPQFSASCHGGKVTGDATVGVGTLPTGSQATRGRDYQVNVRTSGVRFASLLDDWKATPVRATAPDSVAGVADQSRGELDANVSLAGVVGDSSARRGRGSGAIAGGKILNLPLVIPLVRVGNLELPVDEPLDFANAEFFIQGPLINFEQLSVFSKSVQIIGFGTLEWPGMQLDMRFRPKARNRIPLITSMVESIRNELLAAQVQGTLIEPVVEMKTLSGTTRFVGRIFGATPTEQQQRLDRIEAEARQSPAARPVDRDTISPR
jgi:hypothetical protein